MKSLIWLTLLLWFLFPSSLAFSQSLRVDHSVDHCKMAIGTIQSLSRNTLVVYDETDQTVKWLVYLDYKNPFQPGDRVRIYYTPEDNMVRTINKMAPVKYSPRGQNRGYLVGQPKD